MTSNGFGRIAVGLLIVAAGGVAGAQDTVFVSVRGTAWDSLRNAPLAGAFIAIAGSSRTAVSDARGRFRIDSVAAGPHTFSMQHDALDSIGFSGRSTRATLDATHYAVVIAVPSFATLWRGLCGGGAAPKDSGIVYGAVRDVADKPLRGAAIGIAWKDVSYRRSKGFDWRDMGGQTVADSMGRYALCGVPIDVGLHLAAQADSLVSAVVDVPPLTHRVARRDFRLGRDSTGGAVDAGTVIGTLTAKGGGPMAGAIITIEGAQETRSGDDGRFVVRGVRPGTRQVEVKAIGAAPVTAIVDVAANDTTNVVLELGRVQTLEAVRVSAPTFSGVMIRNIDERRAAGLGYYRDSTQFQRLPTIPGAFEGIAGLGTRWKTKFVLYNKRSPVNCYLAVWIDRIHLDMAALSMMQPDDLAAIEVFLSVSNTPPEFQTRDQCGAVVVWTKRFLRK